LRGPGGRGKEEEKVGELRVWRRRAEGVGVYESSWMYGMVVVVGGSLFDLGAQWWARLQQR